MNADPHSHIPGWGADLDRSQRPGVPKERRPPRLEGVHWSDPPPPQLRTAEILKSTEHFVMPPVFGTSVPPRGLSGWMRRRAFRQSENDLRHWLLLLAADRVDVAEGLLSDVRRSPSARSAVAVIGAVGVLFYLTRRSR